MSASNRRVRSSLLFSALLAAAALVLAGCPAADQASGPEPEQVLTEVPAYPVGAFLDVTAYGGGSFSPDKSKVLVHHNASGIYNAYALPVDGGDPIQLTDSTTESIYVSGYFPEDERFLYVADQGGNELNHVYVREVDGTVRDLTPGEGDGDGDGDAENQHRAQFLGWTPDLSGFLIGSTERDPRFSDLYLYDPADYSRTLVWQNDGYFFGDLSPDRSQVVITKVNGNTDADLLIQDLDSGEVHSLSLEDGESMDQPVGFSVDGAWVYYVTDRDSEFAYLARIRPDGSDRQEVLRYDWDIWWASFTHPGNYLVVAVNADARTAVHLYEAASLGTPNPTEVLLPALTGADITSLRFSRDESMYSLFASTDRTPSDLYVATLGDAEPRRLTRALSEELDPAHLVSGEVVRFTSFDGVEIPGILYKPHQANAEGAKLPAIVWVHGGPGGQSRVGFSAQIQYMVNRGYVIYAINNRGSSGYGKTFFHLDDRAHGEGDLDDCVTARQMLIDTGYVDPDRIGIAGGSYGGYMVLAALAFRPDAFDAGVDIFGVANWVRTTASIPPWWEAQRKYLEAELGDFDDIDYLRSISPLFHADKIRKPLLVLQGANDPRVLKVESDEIVEAVRANGVPVEYIVFDDEGHGFVKRENKERGYQAIVEFLDTHLTGEAAAGTDEGSGAEADAGT